MSRERNSGKVTIEILRGDLPHLKAQNLHLINQREPEELTLQKRWRENF